MHACAAILSDQIAGITLFAPPNDAINATLEKFGLDFEGLLKNTHLCTQIMQYHILPSPIEVRGSHCHPPCRACRADCCQPATAMHVMLPCANHATVAEVKHSPHLSHGFIKNALCGVSHSTQHSRRCKISPTLLNNDLRSNFGSEISCYLMQYSAFKEGYSFNTLEEGGNDIRDSLRIRRNGDNIRIVSGKTTATVGTNGSKVCMVSPQLPSPNL